MNPSRIKAITQLVITLSMVTSCQGSDRESESVGASTTTTVTVDTAAIRALAKVAEEGMGSKKMQYVHEPDGGAGWYIADWKLTHEGKPLLVRGTTFTEGGDCEINRYVMAWDGQVQLLRAWGWCAVDMPQSFDVDSVFFAGGEPIAAHHSTEEPSTDGKPGRRSRRDTTEPDRLACAKQFADAIMAADVKAIDALKCDP